MHLNKGNYVHACRELVTVGLSNVVVSLCGAGFTGSYIFRHAQGYMREDGLHISSGTSHICFYIRSLQLPSTFTPSFERNVLFALSPLPL